MKKRTLMLIAAYLFMFRLTGQEAPKVRFEKVSEEEMNIKLTLMIRQRRQ